MADRSADVPQLHPPHRPKVRHLPASLLSVGCRGPPRLIQTLSPLGSVTGGDVTVTNRHNVRFTITLRWRPAKSGTVVGGCWSRFWRDRAGSQPTSMTTAPMAATSRRPRSAPGTSGTSSPWSIAARSLNSQLERRRRPGVDLLRGGRGHGVDELRRVIVTLSRFVWTLDPGSRHVRPGHLRSRAVRGVDARHPLHTCGRSASYGRSRRWLRGRRTCDTTQVRASSSPTPAIVTNGGRISSTGTPPT
jgi:hypothetical protein